MLDLYHVPHAFWQAATDIVQPFTHNRHPQSIEAGAPPSLSHLHRFHFSALFCFSSSTSETATTATSPSPLKTSDTTTLVLWEKKIRPDTVPSFGPPRARRLHVTSVPTRSVAHQWCRCPSKLYVVVVRSLFGETGILLRNMQYDTSAVCWIAKELSNLHIDEWMNKSRGEAHSRHGHDLRDPHAHDKVKTSNTPSKVFPAVSNFRSRPCMQMCSKVQKRETKARLLSGAIVRVSKAGWGVCAWMGDR